MKRYLKTLLVILFLVTWSAVNAGNVRLSGLKCEHLYNPVGIDDVAPRLSWQLEDSRKGAVQAAYRIIVGKDSEAVSNDDGDVWDTGKILGGDIGGWFFRGLAGIRPDSSRPGFRHIVLTPAFLGPEKLSAGHVSPYGRISVSWKLSKGKARYHVEVPAGCTATLMLPGHVEGAGRSMELCSGTHDMTFRIIDCKQ